MKSVLHFVRKRYKAFLFVLPVLILSGVFLYPAGYMEQQRQLWNEYMDQSPDYTPGNHRIMYERSMLYGKRRGGDVMWAPGEKEQDPGELIKQIKEKIQALNNKEAPDWEIDLPTNPDLEKLSPQGMTELELFSLPPARKTSEYYAELLARFQKDGWKTREILLEMQKNGIAHASFLSSLFQYMVGSERSFVSSRDKDIIPQIPGYSDYMDSVNSGDYSAYNLGKVMGFFPDSSLLEQKVRGKADRGDPLAQKQLGDLLMDRLQKNYGWGDTQHNWDKIHALPSFLEKSMDLLPYRKASEWKKALLKKLPKKDFLNRLQEKKDFDEVLLWYRKSADQGNPDAMYSWLTANFNYMPRYFTSGEWKRVRKYNDALMHLGDWRICSQLTFSRKITLHFIPFLLYSHGSLDALVRQVDESGRGDGSLSCIKYSHLRQYQNQSPETIGIAAGNGPSSVKTVSWEPLSIPKETNLADRLKKLAKISPYSCTFHFINRNYIEKSSPESIQITKNVLEKYAAKGDSVSLYIQGWFYQEGLGCDKDPSRALELWEKAFLSFDQCGGSDVSLAPDTGTVPLVYALPRKIIDYNLNPDFPKRNPARAFELASLFQDCDLSCTNKNSYEPSFLYYLGQMYERGEGTAKNPGKAFDCYKKGSDLKNPYCIFGLGRCHDLGIGVDVDKEKALSLYETASFQASNPKLHRAIDAQKKESEKAQNNNTE